jgi:hypothetical protein
LKKKDFRQAKSYTNQILKHALDSPKHTAYHIEALIGDKPNDMTEPIRYCQAVQERFITNPHFLFWRGRVLLYHGGQEVNAKKYLRAALDGDPDNV